VQSYISLTAAAQSIGVAKSSMASAISQGRVLQGCVWRYRAEGGEAVRPQRACAPGKEQQDHRTPEALRVAGAGIARFEEEGGRSEKDETPLAAGSQKEWEERVNPDVECPARAPRRAAAVAAAAKCVEMLAAGQEEEEEEEELQQQQQQRLSRT
jgi:hypothetical protein